MLTEVEAAARAMSKPERAAYLREHGWYRLSYSGAQTWFSPGWKRSREHTGVTARLRTVVEPPEHDRCFYSLAAAIRKALISEREQKHD